LPGVDHRHPVVVFIGYVGAAAVGTYRDSKRTPPDADRIDGGAGYDVITGTIWRQSFDFSKVHAIGTEAKEKLKRIQPRTLGQASRISGINPSDVQILLVYMGR
jgi:hypothetical protein